MSEPFDLKAIDPKRDPKYSKRLYQLVRKEFAHESPVVYFGDPYRHIHDIPLETLYIGTISKHSGPCRDDFFGCELKNVYNRHVGTLQTYCWPCGGPNLAPVPDFWDRYRQIGICAIDEAHWHYDERWDTQGDERVCRWCGKRQRLERYTHTEERTRWVEAP